MFLDFNSIKVRLKLTLKNYSEIVKLNFNSIKVRLKHSTRAKHLRSVLIFQFHKGTIKTFVTMKIFLVLF